MNIILEGPDNAGKSTLSRMIAKATGLTIQPREGKPRSWGATLQKAQRYLELDHMIIDRHIVVSQNVYNEGLCREEPDIPPNLVAVFYRQTNFFIYCRAIGKGLTGHRASGGESDEHMRLLDERYAELVQTYDKWAAEHAHIVYHKYNEAAGICRMVKGLLG